MPLGLKNLNLRRLSGRIRRSFTHTGRVKQGTVPKPRTSEQIGRDIYIAQTTTITGKAPREYVNKSTQTPTDWLSALTKTITG